MNTERFKQRLLNKERELVEEMGRLEDEASDSGDAEVRDSTDDAASSQSASEALEEDVLLSQTLTLVRNALKRIEDGGASCVGGRSRRPAWKLFPGQSIAWRTRRSKTKECMRRKAVQRSKLGLA